MKKVLSYAVLVMGLVVFMAAPATGLAAGKCADKKNNTQKACDAHKDCHWDGKACKEGAKADEKKGAKDEHGHDEHGEDGDM